LRGDQSMPKAPAEMRQSQRKTPDDILTRGCQMRMLPMD